MSKTLISSIVVGFLVLIVGMWFTTSYINYTNQAVTLQNQASAKLEANKVIYDKVWKTLQQKAGVADQYATAFKNIYTEVMDARYSNNDNLLFKFVNEANPNFNSALYEDLSRSITAERAEFAATQIALIDIKREHDNLRTLMPSKWFLAIGGIKELQITIVTSAKTKDSFKTGEENDVDLFPAKGK